MATQHTPNSSLIYGSEFKPTSDLQPLLQLHPKWPIFKDILDHGATYPLSPISEEDRIDDIKAMKSYGNHQSATKPENAAALDTSFDKEVKYHWAIPLDPTSIEQIPGAQVAPLGVAVQWTLDSNNNRKIKRRTTHDGTMSASSTNRSCNKRTNIDLLPECEYGHALLRYLHGLHNLRQRHPLLRILQKKEDLDAAYRRIHAASSAAVVLITILHDIAYLLLRLPFGSSPAPTLFSIISDTITDVIQDLTLDPSWTPSTLHSSLKEATLPPIYLPDTTPIAPADALLVPLPPRDIITDNFIDDIIQVGIATEEIIPRMQHSIPLVFEAVVRAIHPRDATTRDPFISLRKHLAEGRLEETKTVLGWLVNSRSFRIYLPPNKIIDWVHDIDSCINTKACTKEKLHSIIGRFNHVGQVIHLSRYFLTRLRHRLHAHPTKPKYAKVHFTPWEMKDLRLWRQYITYLGTKGVSINNVCFTKPSATTYSDACEWGLGGYSMQGTAWRFLIPKHLQLRASINLLEFIAAITTIHLSLLVDTHHTDFPRLLSFTDSSSALGWLYHSTFNPVSHPKHDDAARHLALLLFNHEAALYPNHIPGKRNVIADSLSRDFHLTDTSLTSLLHSISPQHITPPNLSLQQLPTTLTSWIVSTLESLTPATQSLPTPSPSEAARGTCGPTTSTNATSTTTPSLTPSPPTNAASSSPDSPTASAITYTATPPKTPSLAATSLPPSRMWFRPSGKTYGLTHPATQQDPKPQSSPIN